MVSFSMIFHLDVTLSLYSFLIIGVSQGCAYGLIALGFVLIYKATEVVNFAHGALMMLGMYATYWIATLLQLNVYVTIVFVLPLLFLVGVLFQKCLISPIMNAPGHNQLFLTLGERALVHCELMDMARGFAKESAQMRRVLKNACNIDIGSP